MKLHYNPEINERKDIAKRWAEKVGGKALFLRHYNMWAVSTENADTMFCKDGIIEGPLTCQQVDELSYLLRDWEFADQESKDEYAASRKAFDDYAIPDDTPAFEDLKMTMEDELGVPRLIDHDYTGDPYADMVREAEAATDPYADYDRVERPIDGFESTAEVGKLRNLIDSHKTLIQKAIGADNLDVHEELDGDKPVLAFYWLPKDTEIDLFCATIEMISWMCRKALELRKVDPTELPVDDEKFAFSRFMHRIGMVGAKYKKQRKILMRNLEGSTWRKAVEERNARRALEEQLTEA